MKNIFLSLVTLLASSSNSHAFQHPDSAFLNGRTSYLHDGDTVMLSIKKYGNFYADKELNATCKTTIKNGGYQFSISSKFPVYFSLIFSRRDLSLNLTSYLIEAGDDLSINSVSPDSIQLSGNGSERLKIQITARKISMKYLNKLPPLTPRQIMQRFSILDSSALNQIDYLMANKKGLGDTLYTILVADIIGESNLKIDNFLPYYLPTEVEVWRRALIDYKNEIWEKYSKIDVNHNLLLFSYAYANGLIAKYRWDSSITIQKPFRVRKCYEWFKNKYKGLLRERIVTTLLYENKNGVEDISYCLKSSLSYIKNKDFKRILLNVETHLTESSNAYNFKLPDPDGIVHEFSGFNGKVVLLDFWFTGCLACRQLKPKIDSIANLYRNKEIVFISISIDKNKDQWLNSVRKGIYTPEQAINLYTEGRGDAHPIISYYYIDAYPTLLLIDKQGKLCNNPVNPRIDNGSSLVDLIDKSLNL